MPPFAFFLTDFPYTCDINLKYMNTKIKLKARNVNELLKLLEKSGDTICTLELDLEVSKSIIKILDNYSEDWDFSNKVENSNISLEENKEEDKAADELQGIDYYTSSLGVKDYNSLATLVEAIFRLYKQSPNIKFESRLYCNTLEAEYNLVASSPISVEHSLITMIIETYYNKATINEAIEDTIEKLRGLWLTKKLSEHPGVTSLTKILYGGGK